jgi:hypothetical protein
MSAFDDETLMAFADDALEEPERSAVAAAIAADPALRSRVQAFAETRRLVRELHAPLAATPVPAELAAQVAAMVSVTPGPAIPATSPAGRSGVSAADLSTWRARRRALLAPVALAAGLATLIAGPIGYLVGTAGPEPVRIAVSDPLPGPVADALDGLPSGDEVDLASIGRLRAIATFEDAGGTLCREFELDRTSATTAVACRADAGWRVTFAVEAPLADGYAPASALAALDAYLAAIAAGAPMEPAEERAALPRGKKTGRGE